MSSNVVATRLSKFEHPPTKRPCCGLIIPNLIIVTFTFVVPTKIELEFVADLPKPTDKPIINETTKIPAHNAIIFRQNFFFFIQ